MFKTDNYKVVIIGNETNKTVINSFKNLMHMPNIRATGRATFLTFNAKKAFNHLSQAFIKALIFQHLDLESHIQIEIDVLGYAIVGVLSQFNKNFNALLNDLNKSDFGQ